MSTMLACGQWDTCKAYILGRTEASSSKRFIGGSPSVYMYLMTPVITCNLMGWILLPRPPHQA